jgi:hypothetical protein
MERSDSKEGGINEINVLSDADAQFTEVHESAFIGLTRFEALKIFWKSTVFCLITTFGVVMDGYQTSLPGRSTRTCHRSTLTGSGGILANRGFISQFGTIVNPTTGAKSLNAQYVSAWSGLVS